MKILYFVRHGESEFNRAGIWTGTKDNPLTPKGNQQAKNAGKTLKKQGFSFDIIVSSPLIRAHNTAKHIANELDYNHSQILLEPKLVERHFGELEGRRDLVDATRYFIDESSIDHYEGVETLDQLQARANEALETILSLPHKTILIVGHGAHGRAMRRKINNWQLSKRGPIIKNAEIVRLK